MDLFAKIKEAYPEISNTFYTCRVCSRHIICHCYCIKEIIMSINTKWYPVLTSFSIFRNDWKLIVIYIYNCKFLLLFHINPILCICFR